MRKEQILSEELARMRQLMGMSGQLYQKPIFREDEQRGVRGHIAEPPNPRSYKGGEENPEYRTAFDAYNAQHAPPPAPAPAPAPAAKIKTPPPSKARPKKGTEADSAGSFVGNAGARSAKATPTSRGDNRYGKRGSKATKSGTKKVNRGKVNKKGKKKKEN